MNALQVNRRIKALALPPNPTVGDLARVRAESAELMAMREGHVPLDPIPVLEWPADLGGGVRFQGYASRWTPATDGSCRQRGDFAGSIPQYLAAGGPLTLGHDERYPLGRVMSVWEEEEGLAVDAIVFPARNDDHQTIIDGLTHGLIRALSWSGFSPDPRAVVLDEICLTDYPGHPDAIVTAVQPL